VTNAADKPDPAYYRWHCDEGIVEITMPSPFCISPESQESIECMLELIRRQMERGVAEYARRKGAVSDVLVD